MTNWQILICEVAYYLELQCQIFFIFQIVLRVTSGRKCLDPAGHTAWHPSPHLISVPLVVFQHRWVPGLQGVSQHHVQLVALERLARPKHIIAINTDRSILRFNLICLQSLHNSIKKKFMFLYLFGKV